MSIFERLCELKRVCRLYRSRTDFTGFNGNKKDDITYVSDEIYRELVKCRSDLLLLQSKLEYKDYSSLSDYGENDLSMLEALYNRELEWLSSIISYNKHCRMLGVAEISDYRYMV